MRIEWKFLHRYQSSIVSFYSIYRTSISILVGYRIDGIGEYRDTIDPFPLINLISMTEKSTIKTRKIQYNSWVYEYCTENENVQEDEHKYKPMYDGKDFLTCNLQVKNSKYGINLHITS